MGGYHCFFNLAYTLGFRPDFPRTIIDRRRVPWNQITIPNSFQTFYLSLRFSIGLTAIFFSVTFSPPSSGIASSRGRNCSTSCFPLRSLASLITFNLPRTPDQTYAARKFVTKPTPPLQVRYSSPAILCELALLLDERSVTPDSKALRLSALFALSDFRRYLGRLMDPQDGFV
jgi:hypothetical protein